MEREETNLVEYRAESNYPAVIEAQYSVIPASGWGDRGLTAPNLPVPIPDYLGAEWKPDWSWVHKKTPRDFIRVARNTNTGAIMYNYLPLDFYIRTLDRIFHGRNWGDEVISEGYNDPSGKDKEYVVALQLVAPGMFRPVRGVGSSIFHASNPQDSDAKTRAGAYSAALKNACKAIGIGRDIEEDDPEVAKIVEDRHRTINTVYERLVALGAGEQARAVIKRVAPSALLTDGTLLVATIEFPDLEGVQKDLLAIANKAVNASKVEAPAPAELATK